MKWIALVGLCLVVRDGGGDVTWWNRHAASISCSAPGYFVNPADCKSFYRCVDRSTWDKPALQRYDFTCPQGQVFDQAVSVCTKPGSNGCADPWWPAGGSNSGGGSSGGSGGGGNNAAVGDSNGLDLDPPLFSSTRKTTTKPPSNGGGNGGGSAWFEGSRPASGGSGSGFRPSAGVGFGGGGGGGDPLDAEFGSPSDGNSGSLEDLGPSNSGGNGNGGGSSGGGGNDSGFNRPSVGAEISFGSGRPSSPFGGGGGGGSDPLDAEFGTPSDSGSSGSLEDLHLNNSGDQSGNKASVEIQQCLTTNCATTNRPSNPTWFNRPSPSKNTNWDRNDRPSSSERFDPWSSNQLGLGQVNNNNRPRPGSSANANANWGGAQRPGFGDGGGNPFSPWRPTGPWGASESPPISPGNRGSWWDPPFALPFHTASAAPPPPPPPEPWANPFRQRYPSYQIVAYPTWPGPYTGRNPVIVVYSNSKKK